MKSSLRNLSLFGKRIKTERQVTKSSGFIAKTFAAWAFGALILAASQNALAQLDIRISDPLSLFDQQQSNYIVSVEACSSLVQLKVGANESLSLVDRSQLTVFQRIGGSETCSYEFSLYGADRFNPQAEAMYQSQASVSVQESFSIEENSPTIEFDSVSIETLDDQQYLITSVNASDDTDIAYLTYNVTGISASDLSTSGGVIAEARNKAFASTTDPVKVFPTQENQHTFKLSIPTKRELSVEEIAFNSVVLVDVVAVDSSGNQASVSKVAFTGESIEEKALSLLVSDKPIVISNLLQAPVIVPAVEFQFRGVVQLPGLGNGITYQSSHPSLINVTAEGVLYALAETQGESVTITVSYDGLPDAVVPVAADFSKVLSGITVDGVPLGGNFTLPSLNEFHELPELQGVFEDGSTTSIAGHWTPVLEIPDSLSAFLEKNGNRALKSNVAISGGSPARLTLSLLELDGISSELLVEAKDALPTIAFEPPSSVIVLTDLVLIAEVADDVAISNVEFFRDGVSLGSVAKAPYELTVPLSEQLLGSTLQFSATVTDSIGQQSSSTDRAVLVEPSKVVTLPEYDFTLPIDGQRIVENSPFKLQIETFLGVLPDVVSRSGIQRVDYSIDGTKVATSTYPLVEVREVSIGGQVEQHLYETWVADISAPNISTDETSRSISAAVTGASGSENAPSKLIRITKNIPPEIDIVSPLSNTVLTVGGQLEVRAEVKDDSLSSGTNVELYIDGELYDSVEFQQANEDPGSIGLESTLVSFTRDITAEDLGSSLRIQAKVTDFHQAVNQTEVLKIPVKEDQPPTVALTNPVEGASFVSGLPIQLRANAVDDLEVDRVEFFVNEVLVGSDKVAPYAYVYETPENIGAEQVLSVHAVAYDSADQSARSTTVETTLGFDEEPPVANLASPFITATDAGDDIAGILEQSEFVVKVAGFDNVDAVRAELSGVKKEGSRYVLTGVATDVLQDDDFSIEKIPGVLRAYSALRLVRAPEFKNLSAGEFDRYPITITVFDEVGNSSKVEAIVGVYQDQAPQVVSITPAQGNYFANDTVELDVLIRDDRAVERVEINYFLDDVNIESRVLTKEGGLTPLSTLQVPQALDLVAENVENANQILKIEVEAFDILSQSSGVESGTINIVKDEVGPKVSISSPIPGSVLYSSQNSDFEALALDESGLSRITVYQGQEVVKSVSVSGRRATMPFSMDIPADEESLTLRVVAIDVFGVENEESVEYFIDSDLPPSISIRHPAAGSRLIEGEPFTINALVSDNRGVDQVEIFVRLNGQIVDSEKFSAAQALNIINRGDYFSAALRVPNRPESGTLEIGVRAVDDAGLDTELLLDLLILDDLEAPLVNFTTPSNDLVLYAGDAFELEGVGSDNIFISDFEPYLLDGSQEIKLDWEVSTRDDRLEQIRVPNTDSFGSVIAAERFYSDYSGRIRLPSELSERAGETFDFLIRAKDYGINVTDSNRIKITIKVDDEPPVITILSPDEELVDRQEFSLLAKIEDNLKVDSYRISVIDTETRVLVDELDVDKSLVDVNEKNLLDLARYVPIAEDGKSFTLVVYAKDASGNEVTESKVFTIYPDSAPVVSLLGRSPESSSVIRSSLLFTRTQVEDDLPTDESHYYELISSLSGTGEQTGSDRNLIFQVSEESEAFNWSFDYSEWGDLSGQLYVDENLYWNFSGASSQIYPQDNASGSSLRLDINGAEVSYLIEAYSTDPCKAENISIEVDASELQSKNGILDLTEIVGAGITFIDVTPRLNINDQVLALKRIRIIREELSGGERYTLDDVSRTASSSSNSIELYIADNQAENGLAVLSASERKNTGAKKVTLFDRVRAITSAAKIPSVSLVAAATDRFSFERGPMQATTLAKLSIAEDLENPTVQIEAPLDGTSVVPGQTIELKVVTTDNSEVVESLALFDSGNLVAEIGTEYQDLDQHVFQYTVPNNRLAGEIELSVLAKDKAGRSTSSSITLPIEINQAPEITFNSFSSYFVNGQGYKKVITAPDRINYGEFWVRIGGKFRLSSALFDDSGLERFELNRLNRDGSIYNEHTRVFSHQCPSLPTTRVDSESVEILFGESEPTEYEVVLLDNFGHRTVRRFLVHPLSNVAPEIRITRPVLDQLIVAGTFNIEVEVVAADDRELADLDVSLFVNGVPLGLATFQPIVKELNEAPILGAFGSIYDAFEEKYSVDTANEYGRQSSKYSVRTLAVLDVPSGLIKYNEPVELTARIKDSEGAIGSHSISFIGAKDEINPEVALIHPTIGYGPPEFSDFTVRYRGYDNVKVSQLEIATTYGAQLKDGSYQKLDFGLPLRTITDIGDADYEPVTTNNIDTKIYDQIIHVDRLVQIANRFAGLNIDEVERYDVWVRMVARDPFGNNRQREISFPVRIDERPVVDIVKPLDGSRVVESTDLLINANAYDDVGIDSLRITAMAGPQGQETEISNILLRQSPYGISVRLPAFNQLDPTQNRVVINAEAIDTYGAAFGDLDQHRATETIVVEIIEDVPPEVVIGKPLDGDSVTEGQFVLVQINAIDDVGVEQVALNVSGFVDGDKTFTDLVFPYEFLLEVPYGQAGTPLVLSASVTEQRFGGESRTVNATGNVSLIVREDTDAPTVTVLLPLENGTTVAEDRNFPYRVEAQDTVRLSTVRLELYVDANGQDGFEANELEHQRLLITPPYFGSFNVNSISDYVGRESDLPTELDMQLRIIATDGAGNSTQEVRPITLVKNSPPQVSDIRFLDQRGQNLGLISSITEGREYVVSVIASDPEVGVDSVRLYQASGESVVADDFIQVGVDGAAPFNFNLSAPVGLVGSQVAYRAVAVDLDGNESEQSFIRSLTIQKDQPPTVEIVTPADGAAFIEGQSLEVTAEALDDLGVDGIDRVVFYLNDKPVATAFQDDGLNGGVSSGERFYSVTIEPPLGVEGFALQAVAYDVLDQTGQSKVTNIGKIEDTVAPKLSVLSPFNLDVLTIADEVTLAASVTDIGVFEDRTVSMNLYREVRDESGEWLVVDSKEVLLDELVNETNSQVLGLPASDEDNFYHVYFTRFADDVVFNRGAENQERVRIVTEVVTPNHTVEEVTYHEVGLRVSERRFYAPGSASLGTAQSVYYGAVDQYISAEREGAMVAAWSTVDPSESDGFATSKLEGISIN